MNPIIKYGCCGNPYVHAAHWYVINSNPTAMAGAADYYCIGRVPSYEFARGKE